MTLYMESIVDQTDDVADALARKNVAYGNDVVTTLWCSKVYSQLHFV